MFIGLSKMLFKHITFIQRTYQVKIQKKKARVDILINYWDKLIGKLMYAAIKKKDSALKELISKIMLVDKKTQR